MKTALIYGIVAGALVYDVQGNAASLRASIESQLGYALYAGWGKMAGCPEDTAISTVCSSGRDADCSGQYTRLKCGAPGDNMLSNYGETREYQSRDWGEWVSCDPNHVGVALCTSGQDRNCDFLNVGKGPTTLSCKNLEPSYEFSQLSTDTQYNCCGYGVNCNCPSGFYVTAVCTSGREPDCGTMQCTNRGRVYTGIKCTKVLKKDDNWSFEGEWNYLGNTPPVYTTEVSFTSESGFSEATSTAVTEEVSSSVSTSTSGFVSVSASLTKTFSSTFAKEEAQYISNSITQTSSTECNPGEELDNTVRKLKKMYMEQMNTDTFSKTVMQYFGFRYTVQKNDIPQVEVGTCDYLVLYPGLKPQCPPRACKDHPLCQTCCTTSSGELRDCSLTEITHYVYDVRTLFP